MTKSSRLALTFSVLMLFAPASGALAQGSDVSSKSVDEMKRESQRSLEEMREALRLSFTELAAARKSGEIQRLQCVNEALTAVKGLVRLAEANFVGLQEAAAQGQRRTAEHEFVKIAVTANKVNELATHLKSCAGPTVATEVEGRSVLKVVSDDDLPASDDAVGGVGSFTEAGVGLNTPASASPFL